MNKRILELYAQAHLPCTAIDPSNNMPYETTRFSADKFAKLVVKETLNVVCDVRTDARSKFEVSDRKELDKFIVDGSALAMITAVDKHFGFEE